ncbi:hypothetical protein C9I49_00210 [Pseudomonas prosekii]|uniref:Uncharacterized protein n=1 Tax=Pseudomonas prosekii TaxID=1148509 RepID=A0A2U2DES9_9PSED|nr:hypothetical protein C9I49_00210 [Pseudomonas prosekii]
MARGLAPVGSRRGPLHPFRHTELFGFTPAAQPNGGKPPRHRCFGKTHNVFHNESKSSSAPITPLPAAFSVLLASSDR